MEMTIKISLSPEEMKESASVMTFGGPVPSIQPEMPMVGAQPEAITSFQASVPSPDASLIAPSLALEAPMPTTAMSSEILPEQMPPNISLLANESPPSPTSILRDGSEIPVPDIIPEVSSEERYK